MKVLNWSWNKFIVGIALDKMPNCQMMEVWVLAIHLGFATIIIATKWNSNAI